jgi:hypothetical protein
MLQILEVEKILFRSSLNTCTEACCRKVFVNLLRSPGIDPQPGEIDSSESIPGLHKRLQIRALTIERVGSGGITPPHLRATHLTMINFR